MFMFALIVGDLSDTYAMSCHVGLQGSVETYVETYVSLVQTCTCVSVSVDCPSGSPDPILCLVLDCVIVLIVLFVLRN